MNSSLIPFARRVSDNRLVDVQSVPRGLACNCVCPSCELPLMAKQGAINEWHFSHSTRSEDDSAAAFCSYSFFVSARAMLRQIAQPSIQLLTPEYLIGDESGHGRLVDHRKSSRITESKMISIVDVVLEKNLGGVSIDIFGQVEGYPIALYIEHEGRRSPRELSLENVLGSGVVAVSLELLPQFIAEQVGAVRSYEACLREYIRSSVSPRRWLYHPRQKSVLESAMSSLPTAAFKDAQPQFLSEKKNFTGNWLYNCLLCNHVWSEDEDNVRICPECSQAGCVSKQRRRHN